MKRRVSDARPGANGRRAPAAPRAPEPVFLKTPLGRVCRARELLHEILQQPPEPFRFEAWFWTWIICRDGIAEAKREDGAKFIDVATGKPVEQIELEEVRARLLAMAARPDTAARVVDLAAFRRWRLLSAA